MEEYKAQNGSIVKVVKTEAFLPVYPNEIRAKIKELQDILDIIEPLEEEAEQQRVELKEATDEEES